MPVPAARRSPPSPARPTRARPRTAPAAGASPAATRARGTGRRARRRRPTPRRPPRARASPTRTAAPRGRRRARLHRAPPGAARSASAPHALARRRSTPASGSWRTWREARGRQAGQQARSLRRRQVLHRHALRPQHALAVGLPAVGLADQPDHARLLEHAPAELQPAARGRAARAACRARRRRARSAAGASRRRTRRAGRPAPKRSTSVTSQPSATSRSASDAPKVPAPTTIGGRHGRGLLDYGDRVAGGHRAALGHAELLDGPRGSAR